MSKQPRVIIIVGPTAVGKTAAAIRLACRLGTEIISADSRQCFKELDIGVAKPSVKELETVPHYFIGSHSIQDSVTAALYEELALGWTRDIFQQQASVHPDSIPHAVMVGGTGLYIKAYTEGLDAIPAVDPSIRTSVQTAYMEQGLEWLQEQIREKDPAFHASGEIQNPQRLMRALEVQLSTGKSILAWRTKEKRQRPFQIETIGLRLPKEVLHQRIHDRVDIMMEQGLLAEVEGLLPYKNNNALQTVGYRELFDYLEGLISLDQAVAEIKKNTRHYAKRQMTWFARDPAVRWIDARDFDVENITQG